VSNRKRVQEIATSDTAIDATTAVFGAALALVLPAPLGQLAATAVSTTMGDLLKAASHRQQERMAAMASTAASKIQDQIADGAVTTRTEAESERVIEVFEGALLAARDAFEQRKLPLISNLLATTPFTATPIANSVSTLNLLERLTYRQLCLLALTPGYLPVESHLVPDSRRLWTLRYGDRTMRTRESLEGIAVELQALEQQGLIVTVRTPVETDAPPASSTQNVELPGSFALTYAGRILAAGTLLHQAIPVADLEEIRAQIAAEDNQADLDEPESEYLDKAR
jgi:hypothetical protein